MPIYMTFFLTLMLCLHPQEGMPQTVTSASMFNTSDFSHQLHPTKEDEHGMLIFQDGNLISASLEALIEHLIPTVDYYPEVST